MRGFGPLTGARGRRWFVPNLDLEGGVGNVPSRSCPELVGGEAPSWRGKKGMDLPPFSS